MNMYSKFERNMGSSWNDINVGLPKDLDAANFSKVRVKYTP